MVSFKEYYQTEVLEEGVREALLGVVCALGIGTGCTMPTSNDLTPINISRALAMNPSSVRPSPQQLPLQPANRLTISMLPERQLEELRRDMITHMSDVDGDFYKALGNPDGSDDWVQRAANWDGWTKWFDNWLNEK